MPGLCQRSFEGCVAEEPVLRLCKAPVASLLGSLLHHHVLGVLDCVCCAVR